MNPEQKSVSLAMLIVFAALAVKHGWFGKSLAWVKAPSLPPNNAGGGQSLQGLQDWEAALVFYLGAMLIADTNIAPIAPPLTWAVAFVAGAAALGTLQKQGIGVLGPPGSAQGQQGTQGTTGRGLPTGGGSGE